MRSRWMLIFICRYPVPKKQKHTAKTTVRTVVHCIIVCRLPSKFNTLNVRTHRCAVHPQSTGDNSVSVASPYWVENSRNVRVVKYLAVCRFWRVARCNSSASHTQRFGRRVALSTCIFCYSSYGTSSAAAAAAISQFVRKSSSATVPSRSASR